MEIQGKIVEILQPKGGQSSRGNWKKQEIILETNEQFPKKICVANWNDKVDITALKPGDEITASVNIESREFNGSWYTDIKIWKIDSKKNSGSSSTLPGTGNSEVPPPAPPPWLDNNADDEEIPF
jgi:hypothetical protein